MQDTHEHDAYASGSVTAKDIPQYQVIEFTFSDHDTNSEFVIMCRGIRLIIRLFEYHFSGFSYLKGQYLFFLRIAEEDELDGQTVEDFYDCALAESTLHEFFFAETLVYTLKVVAGDMSPTKCETTKGATDWIGSSTHL
ncbi:hypothetical protein F4810DRAFT_709557 [Camillea tinctor]|nr:hypothetical protein F4810DRAFT_709557 [Camillea tinctor]